MARTAMKKDGNHHEIVKEFERRSWTVEDMTAKINFCDIHVSYRHLYFAWVEIKDGSKCPSARKLSKGERFFKNKCKANGTPWYLCESIEDVNRIIEDLT